MGKKKRLNTRRRLRHHRMVIGEPMPRKPKRKRAKIAQANWQEKRTW